MKGKLIVFEGMDGSGKATQNKRLYDFLTSCGYKVRKVSFPDYDEPSSAPLRMYLNGAFGDKPDSVNGYVASAFFAVDRIASYLSKWRNAIDDGEIVLLDRYTTSNMVHQASKLPREQWDEFLDWLYDFEFRKLGLPVPDLTIYLRMPVDISEKLLSKRYGNDESKKDILTPELEAELKKIRVQGYSHCSIPTESHQSYAFKVMDGEKNVASLGVLYTDLKDSPEYREKVIKSGRIAAAEISRRRAFE